MAKDSSIHSEHKKRMRKRFRDNGGFNGFSDHEILEILLNYANVRCETNEISHKLINKFGTLDAVFEAGKEELLDIKGVGETTATLIMIQRELFRIYGERKYNIENKKKE